MILLDRNHDLYGLCQDEPPVEEGVSSASTGHAKQVFNHKFNDEKGEAVVEFIEPGRDS